MKKNTLFLTINALLVNLSFSQVYQHFPMTNARWSEEGFYGTGDTSHVYFGFLYCLGNDTLITGKHYTLVGLQNTWFYQTIDGSSNVISYNSPLNPPGEIFGAIREDTDKRIWFRKLLSNANIDACYSPFFLPTDTEILLYDFNIHLGDSLPWLPNVYKHVVVVDSIQYEDGIWRKRFKMSPFEEYWIEGIGSTLGFFGYPSIYPFCWLNCFWNNGQYDIIKTQTGHIDCDSLVSVGIPEISKTDFDFSILPNPASTQLQIYLSSNTQQQYLKFINPLGQTIQQQTFSTNQLVLDISTIPSGIYFIELQNEKGRATKKIIVQ